MYKALIVEDDRIVRGYMSGLKIWNDFEIEIVDGARDGVEALEKKQQIDPDLVITDISMPQMNGLDLIREIRRLDSTVYILVLSCHDEFKYVKEAMKLGANEYMLKDTFGEETLKEMLPNIVESLRHNDKGVDDSYAKQDLKFYFFNQLIAGTLVGEERELKRQEAGIVGKYLNCAVINCSVAQWSRISEQSLLPNWERYSRILLEKLESYMAKHLENYRDYLEILYLGEGHFCCFVDVSNDHRMSQMQQQLIEIVSVIWRCLKEESYRYVLGVSDICMGDTNIKQAIFQARNMVKLSFYLDEAVLYYAGGRGNRVTEHLPSCCERLLEQLPVYLKEDKNVEIATAFQKVVDTFRKEYTAPNLVIKWLRDMDHSLGVERDSEFYRSVHKIVDVEQVCNEYKDVVLSMLVSPMPEHVSPSLGSAVAYIHENYKNKIGLKEVAEAVHLNASYLSTVFQKEMGVGFSRYLMELRMKTAKKILVNTNYKIKEVAEQSGFYDYHYFARSFKTVTGLSPLEYRKKYRNEAFK